jgi:hypothetical protein
VSIDVVLGNPSRTLSSFDPIELKISDDFMYVIDVKIGVDGEKFTLQVDTGSSMTWVAADKCRRCEDAEEYTCNPPTCSTLSDD